ncbi:hypothetical protein LR48_Vigan10g212300 [Vigna angularis]|uniref:Uncharacterized protein n=1 Tax=Phaseolus angularis TaxID=3914 RepID=A0A0L9VMD7_PHAAN|nr:hypothetical protein LR48_Vigan10g212300 [Vigna angularis]
MHEDGDGSGALMGESSDDVEFWVHFRSLILGFPSWNFSWRKDQVWWHRCDVLSVAVCAVMAALRGFEDALVTVGIAEAP